MTSTIFSTTTAMTEMPRTKSTLKTSTTPQKAPLFVCLLPEKIDFFRVGNFDSDKDQALAGLQKVVEMEGEKGEWGFKALKQMVKVLFHLGRFEEMMIKYRELMTYVNSAVTKSRSEKVINKVLDYVANCPNMEFLQEFYDTTLLTLQEAKNEVLR